MSPVVRSMRDRLLSGVGASTSRVYFDIRVGVRKVIFGVYVATASQLDGSDDRQRTFKLNGQFKRARAFRFGL